MSMSTPINALRAQGNNNNNNNMSSLPPPVQPSQENFTNNSNNSNNNNSNNNNNNFLPPPVDMSQPDNSNIVDDILKDMSEPDMMPNSNINTEIFNRGMDQSQIPPEKQVYNPIEMNVAPQVAFVDNSNQSLLVKSLNLDKDSSIVNVINTIRIPMILLVIIILLSLPYFNRIIFGFVPYLLLESGQVSMYGVLFKGFIGLVMYLVMSYLI